MLLSFKLIPRLSSVLQVGGIVFEFGDNIKSFSVRRVYNNVIEFARIRVSAHTSYELSVLGRMKNTIMVTGPSRFIVMPPKCLSTQVS